MIVEDGKHYLYRHIRLDTNEVFYIGIGTKSKRGYKTIVSTYYRAYKKQGKNIIWNRIISKTKYRVEILLESNSYNFIKKKEKEFIKLYGKKSYYGSLCNITDGGDGTCGAEKPKSKKSKFSKNIYQFDLDGKLIKKWNCGKDIERELGYYSQSIYDCCNNKENKTAYGFQWSYKNKRMPKTKINYKSTGIKIYQYTKKLKYIRSYPSALEASKKLGKPPVSIINCANGKNHNKTAYGFVWVKHKLSENESKILIKKIQIRKSAYFKLYDNKNNEVYCDGCNNKDWYQNSMTCINCNKCSKCCVCNKRKLIRISKLYNKLTIKN